MSNGLSKKGYIVFSLLILILVAGGFYVKKTFYTAKLDTTSYFAVFLSNGQVYFGNMKEKNSKELILTNVYYLQSENKTTTAQTQPDASNFTLIKMGNEIHGPTSDMYINSQNILFYEKLRDDSKVVKSINDSK